MVACGCGLGHFWDAAARGSDDSDDERSGHPKLTCRAGRRITAGIVRWLLENNACRATLCVVHCGDNAVVQIT